MAEIKDRAALESACLFIEQKVAPRRCDSDGVSNCWRCKSVYLAKRMRELLGEADGAGACRAEQRGASEWVCDCAQPGPGCKPTGWRATAVAPAEVTEDMKQAGVRELFLTDLGPKPEAWEEKIARVYLAMRAAGVALPLKENGHG